MRNRNNVHIFKDWVPDWLVFVSLFIFLVPLASGLGIYMGSIPVAASFYGVDNTDINYSMIVYYLAIASVFPLEVKFFNFFSTKPYLITCLSIFLLFNLLLYLNHSFTALVVLRFFTGAISHGVIGMIFALVFKQFNEQRSRILGYATMYGVLFGSAPLSYILTAYLFSNHNFNSLFLVVVLASIPGTVLMLSIIKKDADLRKKGKIPLKSTDWVSFVIYATFLLSLAYFMLYGQYYHWFRSIRIVLCFIVVVVLLLTFVMRQLILDDPYIDLRVYKTRNFRIGLSMLVFFYLAKGDISLLNSFMTNSVNLDTYHYSYVMMINGIAIIIGTLLGGRYILAGTRIRIIWMIGFGSLLAYHLFALRILNHQAEITDLILPLFFNGFGIGILIISIVIFYATAVPQSIGFSASVSGVAFRACTTTASMALTGMFGQYFQKIHYQHFSDSVTQTNSLALTRIGQYKHALLSRGASMHESSAGAVKLLGKSVANQNNLLFIRDYYLYMSLLLAIVILLIVTIPHFTYQIKRIKSRLIPI